MADKEITTFVIDISSSMSRSDGTRNISDLQLGLKYFNDVISSKIIRGRKTDYVTVISVHSPVTDNPYAGDSFQNIEVISEKIAPTYKDLKHFTGKLTANPTPNSEYNQDELGDCFEGVVLAVLLLKETLKLKFTRNIVLITNGESNITSMDTPLAQATYNAFTKLNINFTVIGIDFDKPAQTISETKQKNIASWQQVCKEHGGRLMTGSDALLSVLYNPPLRKVRPMKAFKGQLRFGADFQRLSMDKEYDPDTDAWSLSTNVECYPATKVELLPSGHSYFLRNNTNEISKIGQVREYFVTRDEEEGDEELGVRHSKLGAEDGDPEDGQQKSNETEAVDEEAVDYIEEFDRVKGFKYSNYDLIALDEDLEKESKLNTREGLDIVGFLKKDSFPFAYLTEEAFYVVPESNASLTRSVMSFNSFVQALLDIKCYCIVRYVQKDNSEVKMCILLPIKVFTNENEFVFTCSMVRIPFKEDEKIGRFPFLTTKALATGKSGEGEDDGEVDESPADANPLSYPSTAANKLMESFILSKDLDEDSEDGHDSQTVSITKAILSSKAVSLLPSLPVNKSITTNSKLLAYSPAIQKFNTNLRRMMIASLSEDDINVALRDPEFVQKYLVSNQDATLVDSEASNSNLFNLRNILLLNSSDDKGWLTLINQKSESIAKDLIEAIDIKYITKEEADRSKRRKKNTTLDGLFRKNLHGTFGARDGEYDEVPDLEVLLG